MKRFVLGIVGTLLVVAGANAATFTFNWEGGDPFPTLREGETANLEVYIALGQSSLPPFTPDEFGFLLSVFTEFNFGTSPGLLPTAYTDHLAGYNYTNVPVPPPSGLTGTEVVWGGAPCGPAPLQACAGAGVPGGILDKVGDGTLPFRVSTITVEAQPCDDEILGQDSFVFIADPSSDLAMFRGNLTTSVGVTNGTPTGLVMHNTCTPEPSTLSLLALTVFGVLRRRQD